MEQVAIRLTVEGVLDYRTGSGGNTFIDHQPGKPDVCYVLRNTGGMAAVDPGFGYDRPTFQVLARGLRDPREPVDALLAIKAKLDNLRHTGLPDGTFVLEIVALQGEPITLGMDENERHQHSLNFRAEIARPTVLRP